MPNMFTRSRGFLASIALAAAALAGGCASPNGSGSPTTAPSTMPSAAAAGANPVAASARQPGQHAECLVCKENADLACVDLTVDKDTPHADYNGKTYYFCSDECKHDFEKHPEKYAK
jgi:YHS domain-containing protein